MFLLDTSMISNLIAFAAAIAMALIWYQTISITATGFVNVRQYQAIFLILIPTMVLVISIIKASLALSLGLVGALSIVRFRTPIKDPAELMYIFVAIALGLGLGAGQLVLTSIFLGVICVALLGYHKFRSKNAPNHQGMLLEVTVEDAGGVSLTDVQKLLRDNSMDAQVHRISNNFQGATYVLKIFKATPASMQSVSNLIKAEDKQAAITFVDNSNVIA